MIELACIFYPGICGFRLAEIPAFRDSYKNDEKIKNKVKFYQNQVLSRFGKKDIEKLKNEL